MMDANKIYDLTTPITESTVVYPGDPCYESETVSSLENGDAFGLCHLSLGNHMGTHIDYPAHVIQGGKTSSDYELSHLIGEGIIIEIDDAIKSITKEIVNNANIQHGDIVFFKTRNSSLSKQTPYTHDYVHVTSEAADALIHYKARIAGIDYISIDSSNDPSLSVHHRLLSHNILIVEGLELSKVTAGRYHITIAPLHIPHKDGLPARVFCQKNSG